MPTYVITGVSKGIGWGFLTQLSSDPNNKIIGLVRNKPATEKRVAEELKGRTNVTILEGDLTRYDTLKNAAKQTADITGGSIDYLIANAASLNPWDGFDGLAVLGQKTEELNFYFREVMETNVLGNIHLYTQFMPLILKGKAKKVVLISTGMADMEMAREYDIETGALYGASKAAANLIVAKYSAQYKKDGVLFLSICPGMVDTGVFNDLNEQQSAAVGGLVEKFKRYEPDFKGPATTTDAVKSVLSVVDNASLEKRDGGAYLSHFGNKRWI